MTDSQWIRLDELGTTLSITRGFLTAKATESGDVPVLSVAMIRNRAGAKHFTDLETVNGTGQSLAQSGDTLVAIEGGTVGETLLVPEEQPPFVPSQQVATLRVLDDSSVDPWYLGAWLSTEAARDQVRRLARGSAIQRVPIKDLGTVSIPLVPLEHQHEIGERFRAFDQSISNHRSVAACLEELRETDLTATFAGLMPSNPRRSGQHAS